METTKNLSVCHILAFDNRGGAGQAVSQIHAGLSSRRIGSTVLCLKSSRFSDRIINVKKQNSQLSLLSYRIFKNWNKGFKNRKRNPNVFELFSDISSPYQNLWDLIPDDTSIVQLNWAAYILDWHSFFRSEPKLPIVWRLPDVNPLTGGCHYAGSCLQFAVDCAGCPQLSSKNFRERVRCNFAEKRKLIDALEKNSIVLVAQSKWMADQVKISRLFSRFPTTIIRNGVDKSLFHERPRSECRKAIGIPDDSVVGLIFCNGDMPRKGTQNFFEHFSKAKIKNLRILLVGDDAPSEIEGASLVKIGATAKAQLPIVYSAADFLIFPSMQDNCPNTVLEAQACGVPALCFNNSGTGELIIDSKNGWLIPDGDFDLFISKIESLVDSNDFPIRNEVAKSVNSTTDMIDQYCSLYSGILSG